LNLTIYLRICCVKVRRRESKKYCRRARYNNTRSFKVVAIDYDEQVPGVEKEIFSE